MRLRAPGARSLSACSAEPCVPDVKMRRERLMTRAARPAKAVEAWLRIPDRIEKAIDGLHEDTIDMRGGADGWSIRESVHHLVEANLVASNIIIAALAKSGCTYDWSWVNPDASWMRRVGYSKAPIRPALDALRALCQHISGLINSTSAALRREVRLLDAPGAELYAKTVEEILQQEVEHAEEHLRAVSQIRADHGANKPRGRPRASGPPNKRMQRTAHGKTGRRG